MATDDWLQPDVGGGPPDGVNELDQSMFVLQCICIISVLPISQYLSRHKKQAVYGANHHQQPRNDPAHFLQHKYRYTSSTHLLHTFSVRALPVAEAKI